MPHNGYAWWYLDAISDCGQHGMSVIAFIGSVFSPYYAAARRRRPADPLNHCALNVALYGKPSAWAMTERGCKDIAIAPDRFEIGPSEMSWNGDCLRVLIDERTMPGMRPLRGEITVVPEVMVDHEVALDGRGLHFWRPFAPRARVEVRMEMPAVSWSGIGYFDSNHGDVPLEQDFRGWNWSRAGLGDSTLVLYDAERRDGTQFGVARIFDADGRVRDVPPPPPAVLARGIWRVARSTRADAGTRPRLVRVMEDAPFYTRSEIAVTLLGQQTHAVQESLDVDRFRTRLVQAMLPFRMPRLARR